jgi:hypothetical protein
MQSELLMCSIYLQEVEQKLTEFHASLDGDHSDRFKVTEALSFIEQARKSISQSEEANWSSTSVRLQS